MLVLKGLVGLHRTVQLQLLQSYWLGHRLGLLWYWMVCLGHEQRSFCRFWDCIQILHFRLFCWPCWPLHFFWGIIATYRSLISTEQYTLGSAEGMGIQNRLPFSHFRLLPQSTIDWVCVNIRHLFLTVLETGRSRSGCSHDWVLVWTLCKVAGCQFLFVSSKGEQRAS